MTSRKTPKNEGRLRTESWLLRGISSIPGELVLNAQSLSFIATNTGSAWPWQLRKLERLLGSKGIARAIDDGTRTTAFEWPVREVRAWCPWYYFGGGIKLQHEAVVLRFSFGAPGNMQLRPRPRDSVAVLQQVSDTIEEVRSMRSVGALWQAALERTAREDNPDA